MKEDWPPLSPLEVAKDGVVRLIALAKQSIISVDEKFRLIGELRGLDTVEKVIAFETQTKARIKEGLKKTNE